MASQLESSGYTVDDGFLTIEECGQLLELIARFRDVYDLPEIHRPMKHRSLRYFVIDGEQIRSNLSSIWGLRHRTNEFVNQLTSTRFVPLANTRVGVNVNIMQPGRSEYRWHYDRNKITAILYLNEVEGGETELYPNYRILLNNGKHMRVQRILDKMLQPKIIRGMLREKIVIQPRPGRLVIMRANRCKHSVRAVTGERERINIIFAYDVPDAQFPMEDGLDSYLYARGEETSADPNYR